MRETQIPKKKLVLTGNRSEFLWFLRGLQQNEKDHYVWVDNPYHLKGVRADKILVYGTFWERKDAGDLYREAESIIR